MKKLSLTLIVTIILVVIIATSCAYIPQENTNTGKNGSNYPVALNVLETDINNQQKSTISETDIFSTIVANVPQSLVIDPSQMHIHGPLYPYEVLVDVQSWNDFETAVITKREELENETTDKTVNSLYYPYEPYAEKNKILINSIYEKGYLLPIPPADLKLDSVRIENPGYSDVFYAAHYTSRETNNVSLIIKIINPQNQYRFLLEEGVDKYYQIAYPQKANLDNYGDTVASMQEVSFTYQGQPVVGLLTIPYDSVPYIEIPYQDMIVQISFNQTSENFIWGDAQIKLINSIIFEPVSIDSNIQATEIASFDTPIIIEPTPIQ